MFNFMNVDYTKIPDGRSARVVNRHLKRTVQYIRLDRFVSLIRKAENLGPLLQSRGPNMKLHHIKEILSNSRYSEGFIPKNTVGQPKSHICQLPLAEAISSNYLFGFEYFSCNQITRHLGTFIRIKEKLSVLSSSTLTHSFICSCSRIYVGKRTQQVRRSVSTSLDG